MEPVTLVIICAVSFGGLASIVSIIHQYLLTRNQRLNQLAQERVIEQYNQSLRDIRAEMAQNSQKYIYHELIDDNKEAIVQIDEQIQEIMQAKLALVERYSETIGREAKKLREGDYEEERFELNAQLKENLEKALSEFDEQIVTLQGKRQQLLSDKKTLVETLISQEQKQNEALNAMYKQHGQYLDKMYLTHAENQQKLSQSFIESSKSFFKAFIRAPIDFIASFFSKGSNIDSNQAQTEAQEREDTSLLERGLNKIGFDPKLEVNFSLT